MLNLAECNQRSAGLENPPQAANLCTHPAPLVKDPLAYLALAKIRDGVHQGDRVVLLTPLSGVHSQRPSDGHHRGDLGPGHGLFENLLQENGEGLRGPFGGGQDQLIASDLLHDAVVKSRSLGLQFPDQQNDLVHQVVVEWVEVDVSHAPQPLQAASPGKQATFGKSSTQIPGTENLHLLNDVLMIC